MTDRHLLVVDPTDIVATATRTVEPDETVDWATDELRAESEAVVNGEPTGSQTTGESPFAIHRIGPST